MSKQTYSVMALPFKRFGLNKNMNPEDLIRAVYDKMALAIGIDIDDENYSDSKKYTKDMLDKSGLWLTLSNAVVSTFLDFVETGYVPVLHVFIDSKQLYDFLKSQEVKEKNLLFDFVDKYGKEHKNFLKEIVMVIHHKYMNVNSIVCRITFGKMETGYELFSIVQINKDGASFLDKDCDVEKLIHNLIFYYSAFPDCVIDGTPDEIKSFEKFYHAKERIKLKEHESLIDRSGITPHFRRGYFKRLDSEYYTKKRGQVVFVRSTFVKGQAKTVLDNGERDLAAYAAGE